MYALEPTRLEFTFKTKESAKSFEKSLNNQTVHRIDGKATTRKSLPEFKGHINRNFSVWVMPRSFCDFIGLRGYYKTYKEFHHSPNR